MNSKPCDCLLFIPSSGGGAEKVSVNIANILKRNGLNVTVIFVRGATTSVMQYLDSDIEHEFINANNKLLRYYGIIRYIRKYKPKTVFSSLTAFSSILVICKLFYRNLRVITRQCFMPYDGSKLVNSSIKCLLKYADVNIAQTSEMKTAMMHTYGLLDNQVTVVRNPLDTDDIERKIRGVDRLTENSYKYMAIGRINPVKGFDTLIQSFAIVKAAHPEATLKIMGNVDSEQFLNGLKALSSKLNITDSVVITGYTKNPYKELLCANCFVLSSLTEGLPNVMLEAMYLNLPVAATTCIPFISQAIREGVNGYYAPVGEVEALASAMEKSAQLYGSIHNDDANVEIEKQLVKIFRS